MEFLKKLDEKLARIAELTIIIVFSLVLLLLGSQVLTRYLFEYNFSWYQQLSKLFFVWFTFAGISLAARRKMHLRVSAITLLLPKKAEKFVYCLGDTIAAIVTLFLAYRIFQLAVQVTKLNQTYTSMPAVPVSIMYVAGVLGLAGMGIHLIIGSIIPCILSGIEKEK